MNLGRCSPAALRRKLIYMTKTKKILVVISAIAVVVIISVISWSYGFKQGIRAGRLTNSMTELMLANQHMDDQMANANCEGVRQAVNDHLAVLEKYRNAKGSIISETIYYGDKMVAHVRQFRIERHMSNTEEALKHMVRNKRYENHNLHNGWYYRQSLL